MNKNCNRITRIIHAIGVLPTAALSIGLTLPSSTAHASILLPDEVVVTARRTEEAVQTVPISMTVFNQEMLSERNVTSAADLVNYTPSLNVDSRFGSDNASFSIRGFTQDLRTTPSVAVYFADVVAPRGGGSVTAGDGAGPGSFFDLQNVQVLKGPQGTLFGRNTTGGAIQIVPQEPTNQPGSVTLNNRPVITICAGLRACSTCRSTTSCARASALIRRSAMATWLTNRALAPIASRILIISLDVAA